MGKKSSTPQSSKKSKEDPTSKIAAQENPKPAPVKQLLFGSWTGKTPATLLYEHCRQKGWEKPIFMNVDYVMVEATREIPSMSYHNWETQQKDRTD